MGSRWHPACFRCTVCNELLEHVSSYEHEGRPYCHLDYHEVRLPEVEEWCYNCLFVFFVVIEFRTEVLFMQDCDYRRTVYQFG
jgi:hypothetical protein